MLIVERVAWARRIWIENDILLRTGKTNQWFIDYYGQSPRPSSGPWRPWEGGVFIHYIGSFLSFSPDNEEDCQTKIAEIWKDHTLFQDVGDIEYNFLVCPHGVVYEGRGYERGEANGGASIQIGDSTVGYRFVGRNTGFYSIQGMLGKNDAPSSAMLTSMRNLIYHLRYELSSDRRAGPYILPHSAGDWPTECPGDGLGRYAKNGSDIDPDPPKGSGGRPVPPKPDPVLKIISREGWGARPPMDVAEVPASERTGFVVHYSAANPTQTVRAIQNYHMDTNGWWDIGYNFLVDQAGRLYEGRGWQNEGAHTLGYNRTHIAVCFIGEDGDATPEAKRSIRSLYEATNDKTGKTLSTTYHSALGSTACPGNDLRSWVQAGMPTDGLADVDWGAGTPGLTRSVTSQQEAVNGLGYTPALVVDGVFGPNTEAGVKWLQAKVGVTADGIWGPLTESAYRAYIGVGNSTNGLTSIRTVASQQSAVNALGYSPELGVDGVFGPKTEAGVRWLQAKVGVTADGLWGPGTERAYADHTGDGAYSDGGLTTVRPVTYQQSAVNALGYSPALVVDGVFGPKTEAGVKWLQAKVGVTADGLWGPDTEAAYAHFSDGARLTVDGVFGPQTIRATQEAIGVSADGVWGTESRRGLQKHLNTWADAGLVVDGNVGTATVKAMQQHLNRMTGAGLGIDGDWGTGTTKALQHALNQGRF